MVHNGFCHYDTLGIDRAASKKDIRIAYLQKTKEVCSNNLLFEHEIVIVSKVIMRPSKQDMALEVVEYFQEV